MVRVAFCDSQDLDPSGHPKRKAVLATDATSITKYGRLFCEIAESSASNIDTTVEAQALADRVLSDLAEPEADVAVQLVMFFPFVEICDLYTLAANDAHFDTDQKLAVISFGHRFSSGEVTTDMRLRGKPASKSRKGWFERLTDAGGAEQHALTELSSGAPFNITLDGSSLTAIGGMKGIIQREAHKKQRRVDYEIHISETSGFTPGVGTLVAFSNGREFETGALEPGVVYYLQVVPILWNDEQPVRGSPSEELSFTAGYAEPGHFNPETVRQALPPNGGFEGLGRDISTRPPSHWSMVTGNWKREVDLAGGTDAHSGARGLTFTNDTTSAPKIQSAFFPATSGLLHALSLWVKRFGTSETGDELELELGIDWYNGSKVLLSTATLTQDLNHFPGDWTKMAGSFVAPADTRFARVFIAKASATNFTCHVDDVELLVDEPWREVEGDGEPPFENSWENAGGSTDTAGIVREGNWRTLKGQVQSGGAAVVFTLALADRPAFDKSYAVPTDTGLGVLEVAAAGSVSLLEGGTSRVSLEGVRWRVS